MKEKTGKNWIVTIAWCMLFLSPVFSYMTIAFSGGNTFLFEDGLLYSFPLRVFLHNAFAHGFSPQWMPYSACGFSLLAEGQSGICFPATQIIYRLFSAQSGWIIEMITGHLAGFFCCYILLRHLGIKTLSCLLGASVYAFCIFALFNATFPSLMWCYSLLPAIFWACGRFMEGRPRSSIYCLLLFTLLLLTGHPVIIVYSGMIIAVFVIWLVVSLSPTKNSLLKAGARLLALVGLVVLAVLIASPQWLPMFQQYPFSARTTASFSSPDVLQNTLHLDPFWIPLSLFPTPSDSTEWQFFSAIIRFPIYALFLVMVGILFGKKGLHCRYFAVLAIFVILMAMGPHVGLWKWVHSLPVLKNFRFPFRWLFFLPLSVSVLAAMGLDQLIRQMTVVSTRSFRWILRSLLIVAVIVEIVFFIRHQETFLPFALDAFRTRPWLTAMLWLSALGMIPAVFLVTGRLADKRYIVLGVSLTVISLFVTRTFCFYDSGVLLDLKEIGWKGNSLPVIPQQYRISSALRPYMAWKSKQIDQYYHYTPNLSLLEGRLNAGHYCSFIPYWASDMSNWCQSALNGQEACENILNICSVRWLVSPDIPLSGQTSSGIEPVNMKERENPKATPRANIVCSYVFCANDDELISVLKSSAFDPRQTVALLTQDKKSIESQPVSMSAAAHGLVPGANILVDRPDYIEIEIEPSSPSGSVLVLSDTYYPGWKVFVDGVEKHILRANYAFRGVTLPDGSRRVIFVFNPLVPDTVLALPTIILMALGVALAVLRKNSSDSHSLPAVSSCVSK
jgi:hypothetical protein